MLTAGQCSSMGFTRITTLKGHREMVHTPVGNILSKTIDPMYNKKLTKFSRFLQLNVNKSAVDSLEITRRDQRGW